MPPFGQQPQQPDQTPKITNPTIQKLESDLEKVTTQIAIATEMAQLGVSEANYSVRGDQALKTYEKLSQAGVGKEMSASFAAVEAAIAEASQAGLTIQNIITLVESDMKKLAKFLCKNPSLKTDEVASTVVRRVQVLLEEDKSMLFVDALMVAVNEREQEASSAIRELYSDGSGVVVTNRNDLIETSSVINNEGSSGAVH